MTGQTVLHYRILEKLGEGGMGVVYRAEDTTLHRTVALKFLPEKATGAGQERSRFLQEARAAAILNHPNICTIHAIDEFEGRTFIVMECVEGATLREKIPFKQPGAAYDAAVQIGEALAEAHAKGIVHRDVKSENIMITPKGQIKVMDFGLAKLKGTLKLTRTSSTVGTLGYMSPEQIQGGEVDHRSDIFSLGVVLFEMLTGQLPFRGEHEAAIVYSIVNEEPRPVSEFLKDAPEALGDILAKALEKDPNERYQSAADLAVDLRRLKRQSSRHPRSRADMPAAAGVAVDRTAPGTRSGKLPLAVAGTLLALALGYIGYLKLVPPAGPAAGAMSFVRLTELAGEEKMPDLSPDGSYIAYVREEGTRADIFVQRAGGGNPQNLTEQSGGRNVMPAYSPKGDLIAFRSERDGGGIFVMGSTGESARRLTDFGFNPSWSPDGKSIVLATEAIEHPFSRATESKIWKVDASSGEKTLIWSGDGVQPRWSPDGGWIAFWGLPRGTGRRELYVIRASGGEAARLTDDQFIDWNPVWDAGGRAIYFLSDRGGTMNVWKAGFDPGTGSLAGQPVPVMVPSQNCTGLTIAQDGRKLVYVATDSRANIYSIGFDPERLTTAGKMAPVTQGSRNIRYLSGSPDSRSLAFTLAGTQEDLGIIGTDGRNFRKLTNDRPKDRGPAWSPDGRKLAFYSERAGKYQIWTINIDGSGLTRVTNEQSSTVVSLPLWIPGTTSLYYSCDPNGAVVDLSAGTGDSGVVGKRLPALGASVGGGTTFSGLSISSAGQWLAGSLGHPDGINKGIVIYSFADSSYRIVRGTGEAPVWVRDGRTLLFIDNARLNILDLPTGTTDTLNDIPALSAGGEAVYCLSADRRTLYFVRSESESDIWEARVQ